eukprot:UN27770
MVDFKQSFKQVQWTPPAASSYAPSVTSVATSGFLRDFEPVTLTISQAKKNS